MLISVSSMLPVGTPVNVSTLPKMCSESGVLLTPTRTFIVFLSRHGTV